MIYRYIILCMVSFLFTQDVFTFTEQEVIEIEKYIQTLEISDSLNVILIENLENQVKNLNDIYDNNKLLIQEQDSIILLFESQIDSYDKLVKAVEPKWYDKFRWILYGFGGGLLFGIIVE